MSIPLKKTRCLFMSVLHHRQISARTRLSQLLGDNIAQEITNFFDRFLLALGSLPAFSANIFFQKSSHSLNAGKILWDIREDLRSTVPMLKRDDRQMSVTSNLSVSRTRTFSRLGLLTGMHHTYKKNNADNGAGIMTISSPTITPK